jgi:hypothetical protein
MEVHPLDPDDAPITAAIRAMSSTAKGSPPGTEARAQYNALMESVLPRDDVTFEADTIGGIQGLWVLPRGGRPEEAILHFTVAGSILEPRMRIAILSGMWRRERAPGPSYRTTGSLRNTFSRPPRKMHWRATRDLPKGMCIGLPSRVILPEAISRLAWRLVSPVVISPLMRRWSASLSCRPSPT